MSRRIWDDLSDEEQGWLMRAARESIAYQRELWQAETEQSIAAVKAAGVTVTYPDKAPFQIGRRANESGLCRHRDRRAARCHREHGVTH